MGPLLPLLTRTRWLNGQPLHEPGGRIDEVFFVERGFASMVAEADEGNGRVEGGLVGWEGLVGLTAMLDPEATSFNRVFVQMPGDAYRLSADALRENIDAMPTLRRMLFQALQG